MSDRMPTEHLHGSEIAIVGMACRFPGADNIARFWQNLCDGVESVSFFSDDELLAAGVDPAELRNPHYVKAAALLKDADCFDAAFFAYTPLEARNMDPQQRLLLECSWEALEDAGYEPQQYADPIGVFVGAKTNTYMLNALSHIDPKKPQEVLQVELGGDLAFLGTRISYKLNLKGPSYSIQTACSTALVAVHLACQSLLSGECRMALAGAAAVYVPLTSGYLYEPGDIVSPDGHCRAFDAQAQGTILGSGVGAVVLKRLEEALADGDHIYAVIKGSATNNDGSLKASFTAPGPDGQTDVILDALARADVEADTISYLEAHGTGTELGDPIEILAATNAFRTMTDRTGFCAIGSVKTNIGHLDAAAGMAGLIKAVLALQHQQLPPSLHFVRPNPKIDFAASPFYVNTALVPWPARSTPRRAGVSSFGFGGTNAHIILEEAPEAAASEPAAPEQLLLLSARSPGALEAATQRLATFLRTHPDVNLADVAFTLQCGRQAFAYRQALRVRDQAEALTALASCPPALSDTPVADAAPAVVFLFPGQGAQHVAMAQALYQSEPVFRAQLDRCAELLQPHLGLDLRTVLYPTQASGPGQAEAPGPEDAARSLEQTWLAQPALFAIEYALAQLWMDWGVRPSGLLGHSIGEYVAACLAGVFTLEDALALVAARGRLMQHLPHGAMLALSLSEQEAQLVLSDQLTIAAINGPSRCVVAGPTEEVEALRSQLTERGVACQRLHTSHGFHSAMMEPILAPFTELVRRVRLQPPSLPLISCVSGSWLRPDEATDPAYWAKQLRQPVRFADGLRTLRERGQAIWLEVGPTQTLTSLARPLATGDHAPLVLASLPHPLALTADRATLLDALGQLWRAGLPIAWPAFWRHTARRRLPLPPYPFERQRFWIDLAPRGDLARIPVASDTEPSQRADVVDWFYLRSWQQTPLPPANPAPQDSSGSWLLFVDAESLGTRLSDLLAAAGEMVVLVYRGTAFAQVGPRTYTIMPERDSDYRTLLQSLQAQGHWPQRIVHLWCLPEIEASHDVAAVAALQELGAYSLLRLAQALAEVASVSTLDVWVVTSQVQDVTGTEPLVPAKAPLLGAAKVLAHEYPQLRCSCVDIAAGSMHGWAETRLLKQLVAELRHGASDAVLAYRGSSRWVQTFTPLPLERGETTPLLRQHGVYLLTGGLGGIGLVLAEHLARSIQAKLVLVGRSPFPQRAEWEQWLAEHDEHDPVGRKIRAVHALEDLGGEVIVASADVGNMEQMRSVIAQAYERFGAIHGVIHAAGIAGGTLIPFRTREQAAQVFAPKVYGTLILDTLLADAELDFFMLFSSLNTVLGEIGQADYCAANAFLDAYAHWKAAHGATRTITVNWDIWRDVGLAVDSNVPAGLRAWREEQIKTGIRSDEGIDAFSRLLSDGRYPQIIVCTHDLTRVLEHIDEFTHTQLQEEVEKLQEPQTARARPNLQASYAPPSTETEQLIADLWQQVLGVDPIGVHDNFFELGGHSLLAIFITSRLREIFQVDLPARRVFDAPTVAELALVITDILIADIEALSEEEAQHFLVEVASVA
jgi:acyl transferase domain-containing protein